MLVGSSWTDVVLARLSSPVRSIYLDGSRTKKVRREDGYEPHRFTAGSAWCCALGFVQVPGPSGPADTGRRARDHLGLALLQESAELAQPQFGVPGGRCALLRPFSLSPGLHSHR